MLGAYAGDAGGVCQRCRGHVPEMQGACTSDAGVCADAGARASDAGAYQ